MELVRGRGVAFKSQECETLAIFSHPNHEAAIFGLLQRLRPRLVFLTDGGGAERVRQTKAALTEIGMESRAIFLDHSEAVFYKAILNRDTRFFDAVVAALKSLIKSVAPAQVLCDAMEFYNPVHDIALPLISAAIRPEVQLYEVPLTYQIETNDETEKYAIQRVPVESEKDQILTRLTPLELTVKKRIFQQHYEILQDVVAHGLKAAPESVWVDEAVCRVRSPFRKPEKSCVLRYDWRAKKLKSEGTVKQAITHAGNFVPIVKSLLFPV